MRLLHSIGDRKFGSNFNQISEILAAQEANEKLSFDGIYTSVFEHREQLKGRGHVLFFMGNFVGGDNSFDVGQPLQQYCNWKQLLELVSGYGFELGFHTHSHLDLTLLKDEAQIRYEMTPPFPVKKIAYPYGKVDDRIARIAEEIGYEEGYCAGHHGDNSRFERRRQYLNW